MQDPLLFDLFRRAVSPGATVIDAGANVGTYAIEAVRLRAGHVVAIEPCAGTFARLADALEMAAAIHGVSTRALRAVVADSPGRIALSLTPYPVSHAVVPHPAYSVVGTELVPTIKMDGIPLDRVDVVKLDVEGCEVKALRGGRELLARSPGCVVLVEVHPTMLGLQKATPADLLAELTAQGFAVEWVDERAGAVRPVDLAAIPIADPWFHTNWVARRPAVPTA